MTAIDEARALVRAADIPEELAAYVAEGAYLWDGEGSNSITELTSELWASSLSYQIKLGGERIGDESKVRIGASKYRGLPHLPPDMGWPENKFFEAQLNLADLAAVDRSERLPKTGMLYVFFNGAAECEVTWWQGSIDELDVRPYPDASAIADARYYLDDFLEGETIELEPYWLFYLNQGDAYDYRDVRRHLPGDLVAAVSNKLGAPIATWDSSTRLYGRPHYWQGEDEGGGMPVDFDEDGTPIFEDREPMLMLLQDEFGEGNVHFWCDFEEARAGDFSKVEMSYSGT